MLSRTAAHLYWIGRYMERAEFTSRLVEATIRLSALGDHEASEQAWRSALSVVGSAQSFAAGGETFRGDPGFPTDGVNPSSLNPAPRLGFAWDISGNGRTAAP